jgi:predicted RNase H-like HicB family nuclease
MRYAVIFEKSERHFGAYCPDLPGCVAVGESLAVAKGRMAVAMKKHVEQLVSAGERPPEPSSVVAYIDA